ncbi:hypothetical protein [Methylacidimicrobium sp. B4]|uniref:hypothetical protein n=1 Tax=Methylacidimicrobium sp. B4 TaxID=2796139 RepID=UPI001A90039B|nr:hypothetical protein [Methylacidimicrobium sp. B4]QSR84931.1 hypothetical protein MacB4_01260 [Methylacidimicrobium sp. B4]
MRISTGEPKRVLFARMRAGIPMGDLQCEFLRRFGIPARQFHAIRVGLEGKIASIRERLPESIAETESRMRRAESAVPIPGVRFADGREEILRALAASPILSSQTKTGHPPSGSGRGVAVSHRFLRGPEGLAGLRERPGQARSHCDNPSGGGDWDRHRPRPSGRGGEGPIRQPVTVPEDRPELSGHEHPTRRRRSSERRQG